MILSHASPLCNSFPKILGGAIGESAIMQIDVFGDYLALAGYTYDTGLTSGLSNIMRPVIALASISMPDYYYWAKILDLRT
jgi:hypothetical protein